MLSFYRKRIHSASVTCSPLA